jgi:RecA-family ATPase
MEVGQDELVRRFQRLNKTLQFKNNDNWKMITKEGGFSNVYDDIELALKGYQPDLLVIDNLYSSFGAVNISKNEVLKPILNKIDVLKSKFDLSILLVHHFIKSGNDMGLVIERMQGGAALQNWMEHCILISKTNNQDIRLMRFGKSRGTMHSEEVYGLRWNSENYTLEMMGIINNWKTLLSTDQMCRQWETVLNKMNDNFTSSEWENVVVNKLNIGSRKTAFNWLSELLTIGLIEKIKHGHYRKTELKIIDVE